jgi:hypothetical protein
VATFAAVLAPVVAHALDRDCRPQLAREASAVAPELVRVRGPGSVPLISGASDKPGCPGLGPDCQRPERLAPGDFVVVTGRLGPFACATVVGTSPALREMHGWAPASRLVRVGRSGRAKSDWNGVWRTEYDQNITIRWRGRGGLFLTGSATWGGGDASRAAQGLVNTGEFSVRASPSGDRLEFATGNCAVRMWRLGPYLAVGDNNSCGGTNVTFSGVYRRADPGR